MTWTEVTIEIPSESSEAVTAALMDVGCQGVAETGDSLRRIIGYLPPSNNLDEILDSLENKLETLPEFGLSAPTGFTVGQADDRDWENEWKKHFKPLCIGRRIVIKPSWEHYEPGPEQIVVELDPGMAFGTGAHPTTKLCLELLEDYVNPGAVIADIGTGSGILSLAAARLGASKVHATDCDDLPRKIAGENVRTNGLADTITIHEMEDFDSAARNCDLVIANIIASTIIDLLPSITKRLKLGGVLIGSGIVEDRLTDVLVAIDSTGMTLIEVRSDEIWRAVVAKL